MTAPTRRSVSELVRVGLDDAINNDIEGWNTLLCELTGEPLLQDIFWNIEGVEDQSIQLRVTGYVEVDEDERDEDGLNAYDRALDRKLHQALDGRGIDPESIVVVRHDIAFSSDDVVMLEKTLTEGDG